jgi:hypothetical protein
VASEKAVSEAARVHEEQCSVQVAHDRVAVSSFPFPEGSIAMTVRAYGAISSDFLMGPK